MADNESTKFHVLILGAGLGGLALAQALRAQGISFEIFERDDAADSRFQGWALALGPVVEEMRSTFAKDLPPIESTSHLQPLDLLPEFCMFNADGSEITRMESGKNGLQITRLNRTRLRDLLATNIDVRWGSHLERIEEDDGKVTIHFKDGKSASGDLLVGADGAHSTVREYLFPGQKLLRQAPTCVVSGETVLTKSQYEKHFAIARSGYLVCGSPAIRFFVGLSSLEDDQASSANYYWLLAQFDPDAEDNAQYWTHSASKQTLYEHALSLTRDFDPRLTEIIKLTGVQGMMQPGIKFQDIILPDLPTDQRVTLLGDAAHAMVPNRGQGGNHALVDALKLAKCIGDVSSGKDLAMNLGMYQDEILKRGREAVRESFAASLDDGGKTVKGWSSLAKR